MVRFFWPWSLVLVVAACSTSSGPPDHSGAPCAQLSAECAYCTQPGPKQSCQRAVATADDVQCTVALDDPAVRADCVAPPDGGSDAGVLDADAGPLPVCSDGIQSPDAGCACSAACTPDCSGGGCDVTCNAAATCSPSCAGGRCTVHCLPGSTCEGSCAGGNCTFVCASGSTCANSCTGGGCIFQCEVGAVCTDTCGAGNNCIGP